MESDKFSVTHFSSITKHRNLLGKQRTFEPVSRVKDSHSGKSRRGGASPPPEDQGVATQLSVVRGHLLGYKKVRISPVLFLYSIKYSQITSRGK